MTRARSPARRTTNAAAATTGACAQGNIGYGVRAKGIELEGAISPARDVRIALGATLTDTRYRDQLVGNLSGAPLDPALRALPGSTLSNSADFVTTSSVSWTPANR